VERNRVTADDQVTDGVVVERLDEFAEILAEQ
jgi:hypothetical protein